MSEAAWSYDLIADQYATDMGQSMPFDDVGYYRDTCRERGGRVLELGCGTGRILLQLCAAGLDCFGVDRSLPMLRRLRCDALDAHLTAPPLAQMDLRALALTGRFSTVLAPYSLVTYLTAHEDLRAFLHAVRTLIEPDGALVLDAFVPQPVASFEEFRIDYRRPHAGGWLQRRKRIQVLADGCNRIEREYSELDQNGQALRCWTTVDVIRPYDAAALIEAGTQAGLALRRRVLDYGDGSHGPTARFVTLEFAR